MDNLKNEIMELDAEYVAHTYGRFPVELVSGSGCRVRDSEGREYIDLGTGIAVNVFGMSDPEWVATVSAQLACLPHTSNLYYSAPCARLAAMLCGRTGAGKVFFGNSGAEANECAIKAARKYAAARTGRQDNVIITLRGSFHGRTLATLAATGQDVFHRDFLPLMPGFVYADANDTESLRAVAASHSGSIAGILIEPVQGEGGVMPLTRDFAAECEAICRAENALLMIDEVQTGNGRSGELFAYMRLGLHPDIVTTAKGLGGGLPIGACLLFGRVADIYAPGDHGSTFGGNPAVCAGALSVLSRLDSAMLDGVKRKSAYIFDTLTGAPGVKSVSGMGLMIGVLTEKPASDVITACREHGVLVLKAKDKVRLLPPLNIPDDDLKYAIGVLCDACK